MAGDLVDTLLAQTGLHVGTDRDPTNPDRAPQVARIVVSALPGRSGVALDYEGLSQASSPARPQAHAEHAVLARRAGGGLVLCSANIHSPMLMVLNETTPGHFEPEAGTTPFPMAIRIEVPAAGRLVYSWLFAEPGGEVVVRNVGDTTLVG